MNIRFILIFVIFSLPVYASASDGAGFAQAFYYASMIVLGLGVVAIGVLVYGLNIIKTSGFHSLVHVIAFNAMNIIVTFIILLMLSVFGFSNLDSYIIYLLSFLITTQLYMFIKSIMIYRYNKFFCTTSHSHTL